MKKMKVIVLLIAIAAVFASSCSDVSPSLPPPPGIGSGAPGDGGHGGGPERGMRLFKKHPPELFLFGDVKRLQKKIGLRDEQIVRISAINAKYRLIHSTLWESAAPLRSQLRDEILSENIDRERVRGLLERLSANDIERQLAIVDQRIEIEKELTIEQKQQLKKIKQMRRH